MGASNMLDNITRGVESGDIDIVDAITEIAAGLNRSDPATFKQGWPLISSIEAACEHFVRKGFEPIDEEDKAEILSRFAYDKETDIDVPRITWEYK